EGGLAQIISTVGSGQIPPRFDARMRDGRRESNGLPGRSLTQEGGVWYDGKRRERRGRQGRRSERGHAGKTRQACGQWRCCRGPHREEEEGVQPALEKQIPDYPRPEHRRLD